MLKRLILKSENYVYVYHSGNIDDIQFMGMTEEAFNSARGSYNCCCWVRAQKGFENTRDDIVEDFKLEPCDRQTPSGITQEKAIDCAEEFFTQVVENFKKNYMTDIEYYLVDMETMKGVNVLDKDDIKISCTSDEIIVDLNSDKDNETDVVLGDILVDCSELFKKKSNIGRRGVVTLKEYTKELYRGDSRYRIIGVGEGSGNTIIDIGWGIDQSRIADSDILESLLSLDSEYILTLNTNAYLI